MIRLVDSSVVQKGEDGELTPLQWSNLSVAEAEDMGAPPSTWSRSVPPRPRT